MIEAKPNGCQESNMIIPTLPCNAPAIRMIGWVDRSGEVREGPYRMCAMCADHSLRNRGAKDLGEFVAVPAE